MYFIATLDFTVQIGYDFCPVYKAIEYTGESIDELSLKIGDGDYLSNYIILDIDMSTYEVSDCVLLGEDSLHERPLFVLMLFYFIFYNRDNFCCSFRFGRTHVSKGDTFNCISFENISLSSELVSFERSFYRYKGGNSLVVRNYRDKENFGVSIVVKSRLIHFSTVIKSSNEFCFNINGCMSEPLVIENTPNRETILREVVVPTIQLFGELDGVIFGIVTVSINGEIRQLNRSVVNYVMSLSAENEGIIILDYRHCEEYFNVIILSCLVSNNIGDIIKLKVPSEDGTAVLSNGIFNT